MTNLLASMRGSDQVDFLLADPYHRAYPASESPRGEDGSKRQERSKMAKTQKAGPLAFLAKAQKDAKLSARVQAAVERGNMVTAEEVLQIAKEFGYTFTRREFESAVKRSMEERFAAGDQSLADVAGRRKPKGPPESSCAKGCLSYTKSWHPRATTRTS
jgi:hypothetical protein